MWEGFAQDSLEGQPEAARRLRRALHRHRSLPGSVGQHGRLRLAALYDPDQSGNGIDPKTGAGDRLRRRPLQRYGDSRHGFPDSAKGRFPEAIRILTDYLFRGGAHPITSPTSSGAISSRVSASPTQLTTKTVIRTGAGRFFTRLGVSDSIFLGGNPPFQPTANVSFGNVDNPGGASANTLPLTVTTQSKDFKNPEAWNWNFTVERELPLQDRRSASAMWAVAVCTCSARPTSTSPRPKWSPPTPVSTSMRCGRTRATTPFAKPTTWPAPCTTRCSWPGTAASRTASLFGVAYTLSQEQWTMAPPSATSSPTPTTRTICGASRSSTSRHMLRRSTTSTSCRSSARQQNARRQMLGGWQISGITQFQTGRRAASAVGTDYAGVGQDGSCHGGGQFWVMNGRPPMIGHDIAANGANDPPSTGSRPRGSNGAPLWTQPAKGTFNHQDGIRNIIHNPGFQNWNVGSVQEVRDHRKDRHAVPSGGLQRLQSPELERRELQSDQPRPPSAK